MVSNIRMEYNISINRCVRLILLHKSVFYYTPKERGDELMRMRMKEIAATRVRYGFWRIYILLRREGFMDNHKRVYRVYCEEGLTSDLRDLKEVGVQPIDNLLLVMPLVYMSAGVWIL